MAAITEALDFTKLIHQMTDQGMNTGREQSVAELVSAELKALAATVRATGKAGKLTLTLAVKSEGSEQVGIYPDWKTTMPPAKKVPFVGYADANGNLYNEHFRQQKLDVKSNMVSLMASNE